MKNLIYWRTLAILKPQLTQNKFKVTLQKKKKNKTTLSSSSESFISSGKQGGGATVLREGCDLVTKRSLHSYFSESKKLRKSSELHLALSCQTQPADYRAAVLLSSSHRLLMISPHAEWLDWNTYVKTSAKVLYHLTLPNFLKPGYSSWKHQEPLINCRSGHRLVATFLESVGLSPFEG
jgi:hypothetical protein